jgi:single-stranded-DNA-specific exonuclease
LPVSEGVDLPGAPSIITTLLAQQGFKTEDEIDRFLSPSLEQLPSPELMAGIMDGALILEEASSKNRPVLVYGDYDADGITATSLLFSFFKEVGLEVYYYIPSRMQEGYGLNCEALQRLRSEGPLAEIPDPVLVTVDCGIANHDEVEEAQRLGFSVIITDHHQPPPELPKADVVINPHQAGCDFPCKELAGVGVAFYLAAGLRRLLISKGKWDKGNPPNLKKYLDLVAIGSVADMVPLIGANRILVKAGMEVLKEEPRPGLASLMKKAGIGGSSIGSGEIGFQIAPRINAAGRVGDPGLAVQLLMERDYEKISSLTDELEAANDLRKEISERIFLEACVQAEDQVANGRKSIVIAGNGWHHGVIGLVTGRLANIYCRPTIVFSVDQQGVARGSARSIAEVNILEAIAECSDMLEKFGGHKGAAGLTMKSEDIGEFQEKFESSVDRITGGLGLIPTVQVNLRASINELLEDKFLQFYRRLEPFGTGNPEPVFCFRDEKKIVFSDARKIGKDSLRFKVNENGQVTQGVAFGMAECLADINNNGGGVNMAFKITRNEFRGRLSWEIRVDDIKTVSITT